MSLQKSQVFHPLQVVAQRVDVGVLDVDWVVAMHTCLKEWDRGWWRLQVRLVDGEVHFLGDVARVAAPHPKVKRTGAVAAAGLLL